MAYEPTNWKSGDVVTSAKLNQIEGGIASGGVLIVHEDEETGALDHTWQEIHDAALAVLKFEGNPDECCILSQAVADDAYYLSFASFVADGAGGITVELYTYVAESADSYPVSFESDE